MGSEDAKQSSKEIEWKNISEPANGPDSGFDVKKRLPRKIRQVPECYFLPRRSLPYNLAFFGACIAAGVGAGMLVEVWIKKKVEEDGGVIWEFGK